MELGSKLYRERFDLEEVVKKNRLWKTLCNDFFQRFIPEDSIVLDIGAGYCEFINNIRARKKYAVDSNEEVKSFANPDVEVFCCPATKLNFLQDNSVDIVFMSNFLEHLKNKDEVLEVLLEVHRICKPGGAILILQPNIRYIYKQYWDFFDHHTPLSDRSVAEVLKTLGFNIDKIYPKFLPFTTKSRLPKSPLLARLYLKVPLVWPIMGKQAFIVGRKRS